MRLLFATVFAFAFVSSEAAALWRFDDLRMLAFLLALGALLAVAIARDPYLRPTNAPIVVILALLLAAILVIDTLQGNVDPIDYKAALILLVLLFAPNLARAFAGLDLAELVWRLLTVYVFVTALAAIFAVPDFLLRGRPELVRLDFTGSLIGHTGLCIIYVLATLARLTMVRAPLARAAHLMFAATAAVMVLLTGTRTSLVTIGIYLLLDLAGAREPARAFARAMSAVFAVAVTVALHTIWISDDFLERLLIGSSDDWTSGRAVSQLHWLSAALEQPLGLGFGTVRELLRDGRPALDALHLLEWPHNEPLRFFVEAGTVGLLFVVLLLARLTALAVRAARYETAPLARALMLAIAADMLGQSLFQNYFNSIYHSVALGTVLVTLANADGAASEPTATQQAANGPPRELSGTAATA